MELNTLLHLQTAPTGAGASVWPKLVHYNSAQRLFVTKPVARQPLGGVAKLPACLNGPGLPLPPPLKHHQPPCHMVQLTQCVTACLACMLQAL